MTSLRTFRRTLLIAAFVVLAVALPSPAFLNQYTRPTSGATPGADRWDFTAFPVVWNLNPSVGSNIAGSRTAGAVIAESFNTWKLAPNAVLAVAQGPNSSATTAGFNQTGGANINLVCFVCSGDFTKEAETLGVTITTTSDIVGEADGHGGVSRFIGQVLDADILFNPNVTFTTGGTTGEDLQTVATHEIGHFFGLDHSGVVRAVMFPFAPSQLTTLSYDDVAAISSIYAKAVADVPTGTLAGNVRLNGAAVFGAHVFAASTSSSEPFAGRNIRKTPIGTFSFPDGSYRITGVPPDTYIVIAEPADEPLTNRDISGYGPAFGVGAVQTNFTTRWH